MKTYLALAAAVCLALPGLADQSPPPAAAEAPAKPVGTTTTFRLSTGLTVGYCQDPALRTLKASLVVPLDDRHRPQGGLLSAQLACRLLLEGGSAIQGRREIFTFFERLGIQPVLEGDRHGAALSFACLGKDFDEALAYFTNLLRFPTIKPGPAGLLKQQVLAEWKAAGDNPFEQSEQVFVDLMRGSEGGGLSKEDRLNTEDYLAQIAAAQRETIQPSRCILVLSGPLPPAELRSMVEGRLLAWNPPARAAVEDKVPPPRPPARSHFVPPVEQKRTVSVVGVAVTSKNAAPLALAAAMLSRRLQPETPGWPCRGWYRAATRLHGGLLGVTIAADPGQTEKATALAQQALRRLRQEGIPADEFETLRRSLLEHEHAARSAPMARAMDSARKAAGLEPERGTLLEDLQALTLPAVGEWLRNQLPKDAGQVLICQTAELPNAR